MPDRFTDFTLGSRAILEVLCHPMLSLHQYYISLYRSSRTADICSLLRRYCILREKLRIFFPVILTPSLQHHMPVAISSEIQYVPTVESEEGDRLYKKKKKKVNGKREMKSFCARHWSSGEVDFEKWLNSRAHHCASVLRISVPVRHICEIPSAIGNRGYLLRKISRQFGTWVSVNGHL